MSFRSDHDAALARADALEDEVERERERADAKAKEAAKLRRERDELEARVAQLEAGQRPATRASTSGRTPLFSSDGEGVMLLIAVVMGALFVITAVLAAQG